jgi:hypothetical protein
MLQAVMVKLVRDLGGSVIVDGLGDPESVSPLLDYEIALRGLGNGSIEISLRRKP